jgi:hypothetical protein
LVYFLVDWFTFCFTFPDFNSSSFILNSNSEKLRNAAWFIAVLGALALALLMIATMCYIAQRRHINGVYALKSAEKQQHRLHHFVTTTINNNAGSGSGGRGGGVGEKEDISMHRYESVLTNNTMSSVDGFMED